MIFAGVAYKKRVVQRIDIKITTYFIASQLFFKQEY